MAETTPSSAIEDETFATPQEAPPQQQRVGGDAPPKGQRQDQQSASRRAVTLHGVVRRGGRRVRARFESRAKRRLFAARQPPRPLRARARRACTGPGKCMLEAPPPPHQR